MSEERAENQYLTCLQQKESLLINLKERGAAITQTRGPIRFQCKARREKSRGEARGEEMSKGKGRQVVKGAR